MLSDLPFAYKSHWLSPGEQAAHVCFCCLALGSALSPNLREGIVGT